jgi:hypothetical protein
MLEKLYVVCRHVERGDCNYLVQEQQVLDVVLW